MLNRRRFLQAIAASAVAPGLTTGCATRAGLIPELRPDPAKMFDPTAVHHRVGTGGVVSDHPAQVGVTGRRHVRSEPIVTDWKTLG